MTPSKRSFLFLIIWASVFASFGERLCSQEKRGQNVLRGSVTPERAWWDLLHYDLSVRVIPSEERIEGTNVITFKVLQSAKIMQIDLQEPLQLRQATFAEKDIPFTREGNVYWLTVGDSLKVGDEAKITLSFGGKPKRSLNPPWSGGFTWKRDQNKKHFIATSCQGIGASIWWPNKDHGYDEPDRGVTLRATVPEDLTAVANGRLEKTTENKDEKTRTFVWQVTQPINNYCVNLNIGDYVRFGETYKGERGSLDMDYWVLRQDLAKAKRQFQEAPRTIEALEYWFGPYPFYEDSFKLVQVPYLGMEHQSSVTYGNGFRNGYRGRDLSGTGVGLKFDFIIIHESAHEWFGNNVSMKDCADMWIHESFANYAESLFVEYHFTQKEAADYVIGTRRNISNDIPIIAPYGVNKRGSGDMYYKGGNMLHTIRHVVDNDIKWRKTLRGLGSSFYHKTVTTDEVETYMSKTTGVDLSKVFEQYLRTRMVPTFCYQANKDTLTYWYEDVVDGFDMPLKVRLNGRLYVLRPTATKQAVRSRRQIETVHVDRNFYVRSRKAD